MRKTVLLIFGLTLSLCACKHKKAVKQVNTDRVAEAKREADRLKGALPIMHFQRTAYDFGDIRAGDEVRVNFEFINTGKAPLLISNAYGSCGCTVPDYPKHPIAAGAREDIKVIFNSTGKSGKQHKQVTLVTNTADGKEHLNITANVINR